MSIIGLLSVMHLKYLSILMDWISFSQPTYMLCIIASILRWDQSTDIVPKAKIWDYVILAITSVKCTRGTACGGSGQGGYRWGGDSPQQSPAKARSLKQNTKLGIIICGPADLEASKNCVVGPAKSCLYLRLVAPWRQNIVLFPAILPVLKTILALHRW